MLVECPEQTTGRRSPQFKQFKGIELAADRLADMVFMLKFIYKIRNFLIVSGNAVRKRDITATSIVCGSD